MKDNPFGTQHQQQPIPVQITRIFQCKCGNQVLDQKLLVGVVSAITSPTGKEEFVPSTVLICMGCGCVYNPETMESYSSPQEKEETASNIVKLH